MLFFSPALALKKNPVGGQRLKGSCGEPENLVLKRKLARVFVKQRILEELSGAFAHQLKDR